MTMAAILTVFITMAILGLVLVTDQNLNAGATSLKNRVEIEVFIRERPAEQVDALQDKIAAMPQRVKSSVHLQGPGAAGAPQDARLDADQILKT